MVVIPGPEYATLEEALSEGESEIFLRGGTYTGTFELDSACYIAPVPGHDVTINGTFTLNDDGNYLHNLNFVSDSSSACIDSIGGGNSTWIVNCTFHTTSTGRAIDLSGYAPTITRCTFTGDGYGGVNVSGATVNACLFVGGGDTSRSFLETSAAGNVSHNTFISCTGGPYVANTLRANANIMHSCTSSTYALYAVLSTYNTVYNTTGTGAFYGGPGTGDNEVDPLFVDVDNGNYYLSAASPCIATGGTNTIRAIQCLANFFYDSSDDDRGCYSYHGSGGTCIMAERKGELTGMRLGGSESGLYSNSFESGFGNWTNDASGDTLDWTRRTGSTPSSSTGPGSASSGSYYVYTEATSNFNKYAYLDGPDMDLTAHSGGRLVFDWHMWSGTTPSPNPQQLDLEVNTGSGWSSIWNRSGDQGNQWNTDEEIDLSAYAGQTVQMRFKGTTGSTFQSDVALDNIRAYSTPLTLIEFPGAEFNPSIRSPQELADYIQAGVLDRQGLAALSTNTGGRFGYTADGFFRWKSQGGWLASFEFRDGTSLGYIFPGVSYTDTTDTGV